MSKLTEAQMAAMGDRPRYRHTWEILTPDSHQGNTPDLADFDAQTIHDDDGGPYCVTDRGEIEVEGYNISLNNPGELSTGMYTIVADAGDDLFQYGNTAGYFYNVSASRAAYPQECLLRHRVYVWASGSWSQIHQYLGRIQSAEVTSLRSAAGTLKPATVTITARAYAACLLDREWTKDDATVTTLGTYTPSGIVIDTISTGWYISGSDYLLWIRFKSSPALYRARAGVHPVSDAWDSSGDYDTTASYGTGSESSTHTMTATKTSAAAGTLNRWRLFLYKTSSTSTGIRLVMDNELPLLSVTGSQTNPPAWS